MYRTVIVKLRQWAAEINWPLLVFLLLFLNVKMGVKLLAVLFIFLLNPRFTFGFKLRHSRLPLFYIAIIAISVFNYFAFSYYHSLGYTVALFTGLAFWLLCILAAHQVKLVTEQAAPHQVHRTLVVFFLLNAVVSFLNIGLIIAEIHRVNPYLYQGEYQKYFLNTGDYIKGATFDVSITNAAISAFGVVYFLYRQNFKMLMLCMAVLLLTVSNTVDIMLFAVLALLFMFRTARIQKSMIVACLTMLMVFMVKVSPQNMYYVDKVYNKIVFNKKISFDPLPVKEQRITTIPDSLLNPEQLKEKKAQLYMDSLTVTLAAKTEHKTITAQPAAKIALAQPVVLSLPKDSIHTAKFQSRSDTDDNERRLLNFVETHKQFLHLAKQKQTVYTIPGKVTAFKQTLNFFKGHPMKLLTGTGMGNFSSKLAFRTTGLSIAGGYPSKFVFINPDFLSNHLDIYLNFFSRRTSMHSVTNSPDSVYDQLLAEYGLLGLLAFAAGYVWYFIRQRRFLTYGLPLLVIMCGLFFTGYWFEQLSVVVLFELMLFLDIRENQLKSKAA